MPDWLTILLRSSSLLVVVFFIAKAFGKKQLSKLSVFEYIVAIVIAVLAANISFSTDTSLSHGLISLSTWFVIPFFIGFLAVKSRGLRDFIRGKGTVFIKDGKIMEENLKKEQYSTDELLEKLRIKNFFQVADVEFAILEADGNVSVLPKKEKQPLTPKDLGITVAPIKEPQTVITDGKILYEPLATAGLNIDWLHTELEKLGVTVENVYLGQIDAYGQLTVDLFDDNISIPTLQEKPLLLATMKKVQADLELFSLQTENKSAKQMYEANSKKLQQAIDNVIHLLK